MMCVWRWKCVRLVFLPCILVFFFWPTSLPFLSLPLSRISKHFRGTASSCGLFVAHSPRRVCCQPCCLAEASFGVFLWRFDRLRIFLSGCFSDIDVGFQVVLISLQTQHLQLFALVVKGSVKFLNFHKRLLNVRQMIQTTLICCFH